MLFVNELEGEMAFTCMGLRNKKDHLNHRDTSKRSRLQLILVIFKMSKFKDEIIWMPLKEGKKNVNYHVFESNRGLCYFI